MKRETISPTIDSALTRAAVYSLIAKSFKYTTEGVFDFLRSWEYEDTLRELCLMNSCDEELRQYFDAYLNVRSQLDEPDRRVQLATEYNRLFAHLGSAICPPYETEFGYENVFQKTEAMADIAGFYAAYGLAPSEVDTERVDFISMELEFMSYLAVHEAYACDHGEREHLDVCIDTQRKFLRDHLGRWVSLFVRILSNSSSQPFYSWLGSFTDYFVNYEARYHNVILDKIADRPMMKSLMPEPFGCDGCAAHEIATTK